MAQLDAGELTGVYRDLHAHPELGFRETRTAGIVAEQLTALGYRVTTGVGGTGVVGLLGNGAGPVVLLRADMDGLPVAEETGLPYASTDTGVDREGRDGPVMHACGHDMHMSCLLGAAQVLANDRNRWSGTLMRSSSRPRYSAREPRPWCGTDCSSDSSRRPCCWASTWRPFRPACSRSGPAPPSRRRIPCASGCSGGAGTARAPNPRSTRSCWRPVPYCASRPSSPASWPPPSRPFSPSARCMPARPPT